MKVKFKDGDKVRIKKDLKVGKVYGGFTFIKNMEKYKGKEAILIPNANNRYYDLDIDDSINCWTDEMLEPIEEKQSTPFSITITSDGVKTVKAIYINGRDMKESVAKCNLDEDTFDINTGVHLVLERLGIKKRCTCGLNKKEEIKPKKKVLKFTEEEDTIGEKTSLVDIYNRELYVGDIVKVYIDDKCTGKAFVRKSYKKDNEYYINYYCETLSSHNLFFKDGKNLNTVYGRILIVRSKSYKELEPGDTDGRSTIIEVEE